MEKKIYTIEDIEKKVEELRQEALRIGHYILKCDEQKTPIGEDDWSHQATIQKQYKFFLGMYNDMKKKNASSGSVKESLADLLIKVDEVKVGMATIQQKVV